MEIGNSQELNPRPSATTWVAYCALLLSGLTFIFGNGIGIKLFEVISPLQTNNNTVVEGFIAILNIALAIFVLLDLRFFRPIKLSNETQVTFSTFKQVLKGWKLLWFTWILFYFCLALQWFQFFSPDLQKYISVIEDALNLINGFFFYYLFFVLDIPSVPTNDDPNRAKSFWQNILTTIIFGVIVFTVSVILKLLNIEGVLSSNIIPAYIAIGMAFFFGRLDSHYLHLRRIILAPLYLYAVIQLYWAQMSDPSGRNYERIAILLIALILKFVVFYIVSKLLRKETFHQYLIDAEEGLRKQTS